MPTFPASRVEAFEVAVPAGTQKAAHFEVMTSFNAAEVIGAEIVIPRGHNYLTGLQLALAHSPVIPRTENGWLVDDGAKLAYDLTGYPNTGAWSCFGYNLDIYDHTFHVRFLLLDFAFTNAPAAEPLIVTPGIV